MKWQKVLIWRKKVPVEFLQLTLNNGCMYLKLEDCKLMGELEMKNASKLKYLDLSGCKVQEEVLEQLLSSCHYLQKLSLQGLTLNQKMINRYDKVVKF